MTTLASLLKICTCCIVATTILVSCIQTTTLYSWGDFNNASYDYLKTPNPETSKKLEDAYKDIINNNTGTRKMPPPGICADYGFLLLANNKQEEGKALLQKEISFYPESKTFVDNFLKTIQ